MRHLSFATATLCLLLVVPPTTRAGQIIYDIQNYPADQNGHTVSGTITTDGITGQLAQADILSWTVTIDGTQTFGSTDVGALTIVQGDVQASPTSLTMGIPPTGFNELDLRSGFNTPPPSTVSGLVYLRPAPAPASPAIYEGDFNGAPLWVTTDPTMGDRPMGTCGRAGICRPRAIISVAAGHRDHRWPRLRLVPPPLGSAAAEAGGAD